MTSAFRLARRTLAGAAIALSAIAPTAQARNVRLMEPVPDVVHAGRVHEILGTLELRFGSDSARGAELVRRDVVVKGVGSTKMHDVGADDKVRPADHELCARALEDAVTQLAFAARGSRASAIVGVISRYGGVVFDDPAHYECHVGVLKAAVTLRAQLARGVVAVPPPPAAIVAPPPPPPSAPMPVAPDAPPPPAATFQPLPPVPAPRHNASVP